MLNFGDAEVGGMATSEGHGYSPRTFLTSTLIFDDAEAHGLAAFENHGCSPNTSWRWVVEDYRGCTCSQSCDANAR